MALQDYTVSTRVYGTLLETIYFLKHYLRSQRVKAGFKKGRFVWGFFVCLFVCIYFLLFRESKA